MAVRARKKEGKERRKEGRKEESHTVPQGKCIMQNPSSFQQPRDDRLDFLLFLPLSLSVCQPFNKWSFKNKRREQATNCQTQMKLYGFESTNESLQTTFNRL
mmetsp:Transcript_14313/g.28747  ORF Transcript_14313/g.28747 Transcript_14313/m.28747 type:complete len:102 (-) Transcript_14313:1515-1820(-)